MMEGAWMTRDLHVTTLLSVLSHFQTHYCNNKRLPLEKDVLYLFITASEHAQRWMPRHDDLNVTSDSSSRL